MNEETGIVDALSTKELNELRFKVAEAIRGDGSDLIDIPWGMLSADRQVGWLGDADRALAVVNDYLTARRARTPSP